MTYVKNQQSNTDIANSLVFAIKYDLVDYKAVRNWADDLIANSDTVAPWMLDLSFCTANDVAFHLRNVPGAICKPTIHGLLFGLAYDAYETGAIDRFGLRDVGWAMYLDDPDTIPDHWGLALDLAIETQIDGYATIVDVNAVLAETLDQLRPFVENVPLSLRRDA